MLRGAAGLNFAGYELGAEIGRGGAGTVYRARARDGREVALKVLGTVSNPDVLLRFARERRLLADLGETHYELFLRMAPADARVPRVKALADDIRKGRR